MKPVIRLTCFLSVVAFAAGAWAQKVSPLEREFSKLQQEFFKAEREYYKPIQDAKSEEEGRKIKLDPAKYPGNTYLPKFKAFAKKAGKNDAAIQGWIMVMRLSATAGDDKTVDQVVRTIMRDFIASPKMTELASVLRYHFYDMEETQRKAKIDGLLFTMETRSPVKAVQATALYARGTMRTWNDPATAKKLFTRIVEKYPGAPEATRAKRDIFEIDHLSVGKVAPDFNATDENGVAFKLSDYRGKVVVLEFWGFW